jgi:hypothetical protein
MKAPNIKLQPPEKFQIPTPNEIVQRWTRLGLDIWDFFAAWSLEFGAF